MKHIYQWLNCYWVGAALCMGIFLALLTPVLTLYWSTGLLLIFLQAPVYMLHQVEEHTGDRFRQWVNRRMFGGVEGLSSEAVLWINIPGVWGVSLLSLYAAAFFGLGWGLTAVYLVLVNGIFHILGALATRVYNPGLYTAIALFMPAGAAALWVVWPDSAVNPIHHMVGLGIAILIHVAIIVYTKGQAAALRTSNR